MFEPSELERGHFTDVDHEIRMADMPERFKLRRIPVCPTEEGELDEEAEWVYKYAFVTANISQQDYEPGGAGGDANALFDAARTGTTRKGPNTIGKIREALNCMRNQQFEASDIGFVGQCCEISKRAPSVYFRT